LLSSINLEHITLKHLIAQKDIAFSNSMVEAAHKQLKYRWLYRLVIHRQEDLQKQIDAAVHDFNHLPHHVLHGLSPGEVLAQTPCENIIPPTNIAAAKAARLAEHRRGVCNAVDTASAKTFQSNF
jgi:putative transposase